MEIDKLRQKIDCIDDEIARLFAKRMELCKEVGEYKQKNKVALENSKREEDILERVAMLMPDDIKLFGIQVFQTLFDTSKMYQSLSQK